MGASCSRSDSVSVTIPVPHPTTNGLAPSLSSDDLKYYLSECQLDKELQGFDSALQERTTHVIDTFSDGNLSLEALRAIAGCFAQVNQEVVQYVTMSKKDVWKSPELFELVQQYFDYSDQVLRFFDFLNSCLKGVQQRQLIIDLALRYFEEESNVAEDSNSVRFTKTMQELNNFKEVGDPFSDAFVNIFQSVHNQQKQMLDKLRDKRLKLGDKMKKIKTYKKVTLVIFAACSVGVIIFSVVVAAITAPPLVAALAAAMSAPVGGAGKWLNSLWGKYEKELQDQYEIIRTMHLNTRMTVEELQNIRVLVDKLVTGIEDLVKNTVTDDSTVVVVIADVKKRLTVLTNGITQLEADTTKYSGDVRQGRMVILQGMNKRS